MVACIISLSAPNYSSYLALIFFLEKLLSISLSLSRKSKIGPLTLSISLTVRLGSLKSLEDKTLNKSDERFLIFSIKAISLVIDKILLKALYKQTWSLKSIRYSVLESLLLIY